MDFKYLNYWNLYKTKWRKTNSQSASVSSQRTQPTMSATRTTVRRSSSPWSTETKRSPKSNSTKKPKISSSGPKRKALCITLFFASPGRAASLRNNKPSFTWTTSSTIAPCRHRETVTSTRPTCWKVKGMGQASPLEGWGRRAMPGRTQFGTSSRIFFSGPGTRLCTFQPYLSPITGMHLMTRLCSELVKESSAKTWKNSWRNLGMKTVAP